MYIATFEKVLYYVNCNYITTVLNYTRILSKFVLYIQLHLHTVVHTNVMKLSENIFA